MFAEIAASADNAAISIPIERYIAQLTGFDIPYHWVTWDIETIATAIAASYMNIPLAHTQGGEVTGSIDESVRHAVTKLSHMHFAATEKAKKNNAKN